MSCLSNKTHPFWWWQFQRNVCILNFLSCFYLQSMNCPFLNQGNCTCVEHSAFWQHSWRGGGVWTCKRVIRSRKSKKDRYYNGQKKNRQTIICKTLHRKLKIESFYLHFSLEWGIVVELVEIQHPLMLLHEEMTVAVCNPYRSLDIFRLYIWGFVEHLADQTIRKGANKMKNK